ncbi:MAG: UDP-N-acetylmuramate--L-alanine ligase [Caldilineaceae bacterium]|nr:UDP-N-acetylmuramate--L-alanine ligase [Caldilineaceae bacterium]
MHAPRQEGGAAMEAAMPVDSWQKRLQKALDPSLPAKGGDDTRPRVHLIGIGGAGLSPIAHVLLEQGIHVSGSDRQESERTRRLAAAGATIFGRQGAAAELSESPDRERPDVVLISSAVDETNRERQTAQRLGIPVVKRESFLRPLLAGRDVIAVSGTHGKSTTTSMIVQTLHDSGCDAGYIIGADLPGFGNAHAGTARAFVIEADEYDRMFHGLTPMAAIVTNVEWDHPDCYPTPSSFVDAFRQFVAQVRAEGCVVSCGDDPGAEALRTERPAGGGPAWLTYGLREGCDVRAAGETVETGGGYAAAVHSEGESIGRLRLQAPGIHNLRNALAALTVARRFGVPAAQALASLHQYTGIGRRFELKGTRGGVTVIDDYAHHPTEIQATLAAARSRFGERRIWAVFQPHTFSRTRAMLHKIACSFDNADTVLVTDIYAARESGDNAMAAAEVAAASHHPSIRHSGGIEETSSLLHDEVTVGDVVLTLGAGTSHRIGETLLERLGTDG